jgi:hypothetical protein
MERPAIEVFPMIKWSRLKLPFLALLFLLVIVPNVRAFTYELQVGAWADDGSIGNRGVSVEIRTHIYNTNQGGFQYFWVGDNLNNGAFIQLGYIYEPGYYCLSGQWVGGTFTCQGDSDHIGGSDARWEWQYWSNENERDFSYAKGSADSAGLNGTWHKYTIEPNSQGGWSFLVDDQEVSRISYTTSASRDSAYFVAEKGGNSPNFGQLGPVEFRNSAYLKDDGWHYARALYARVGCAVNTSCSIVNPYGVASHGSGAVIAGSAVHQPIDHDLLWEGVVGGVTLTLNMPPQVSALIDNQWTTSGNSQLSISRGSHAIYVPELVTINSSSRLRFDHWSDGSSSSNRTLTLDSDITLQATYVKQYFLTIDSIVSLKGSGWYDEGSRVQLSQPASIPIHNELGILGGQWAFDGWYKDGAYLASSTSISIPMVKPHTIQLRWHQDYTIPISIVTILALLGLVAIVAMSRRRRN